MAVVFRESHPQSNMKEIPFQFKKIKEEEEFLRMPPIWCSSICRNALNEICVEECAARRDCSGFEEKPNLKLADMPRFPKAESMTKEERFTSVTVYLSKVVDHLQGAENEHNTVIIRRPYFDNPRSSTLSKNVKIEDLLSGVAKANSSLEVGEKCEDSGV